MDNSKTENSAENHNGSRDFTEGKYFISCDWGSTSFRLRLVSIEDGKICGEVQSDRGATVLSNELPPDAPKEAKEKLFADCLFSSIDELAEATGENLNNLTVVVSGMATSAHGWHELPYARPPFPVDGAGVVHHEERIGSMRLVFLSGLCTDADVMRGEESEIVGLFSREGWKPFAKSCVLVLPGTHSKHVFIEDGSVTGYLTYMTGELFGVLSAHSVLRKTVEGGRPNVPQAFAGGVKFALENGMAGGLFRVRSYGLLGRYDADGCASFLSGLLIGSEAVALTEYCEDRPLILCAAEKFRVQYESALHEADLARKLVIVSEEEMSILTAMGHRQILAAIQK